MGIVILDSSCITKGQVDFLDTTLSKQLATTRILEKRCEFIYSIPQRIFGMLDADLQVLQLKGAGSTAEPHLQSEITTENTDPANLIHSQRMLLSLLCSV